MKLTVTLLNKKVFHHIPVMEKEVVEYICSHRSTARMNSIENPLLFIDGTLGGGGHSKAILEEYPSCNMLCIDRDLDALVAAGDVLSDFQHRITLAHGSYKDMKKLLQRAKLPSMVDGIVLDLGVSSHQIDTVERGFTYRFDAPLDMRFDQTQSNISNAQTLLKTISEAELGNIIRQYGEEPLWRKCAQAIINYRDKTKNIHTSLQLVNILESLGGSVSDKRKRNARVFQAIRIAVNKELRHLHSFLDCALDILNIGGRLAIISFHSLEDNPVKQKFRNFAKGCTCDISNFKDCHCNPLSSSHHVKLITKKAIKATDMEIQINPRSSSARLRVIERLK